MIFRGPFQHKTFCLLRAPGLHIETQNFTSHSTKPLLLPVVTSILFMKGPSRWQNLGLNFYLPKAWVFRGLFNLLEKKGGKSLAQLQLAAVSNGYRISSAWPNAIREAPDVPVWPFQLCTFASEWGVQFFRHWLHKLPKDSKEQDHSQKPGSPVPSPKESSLLFFPSCTGLKQHNVWPLPARASDCPAQHPFLKHWSNTGDAQQPGSRFFGEEGHPSPVMTSSVSSLPCP